MISQTFRPSWSQISDSSLAKAILTSRKAFSASLTNSAERSSVSSSSPLVRVRYRAAARTAARGVAPPTTRALVASSSSVRPGMTRSGEYTTSMSTSASGRPGAGSLRSGRAAAMRAIISRVAPTGEVDSSTTSAPGLNRGAIASAAANT